MATNMVAEKPGPPNASADTTSSAYWCFDAYRRGDVYSYALVMWEVLSRTLIPRSAAASRKCQNDGENHQPQSPPAVPENGYDPYAYRAPYQDRGAGWDPGFDDMRRIVCSPDPVLSRPGVAPEWLTDPVGFFFIHIICWMSCTFVFFKFR